MKKIFFIFCFITGLAVNGWSQQDAHFSQYMSNALVLNPAYAGSMEHVSARFISRWQWVGLEGAPRSQTFSVHGASRNMRNGYGLSLYNDKIGITNNTFLNADYAFRILLNDNARLSFGLRGSLANYRADFSTIGTPNNLPDPSFTGNNLNLWQGNIGTGAYFNNRWLYLGLSIPHLVDNDLQGDNSLSNARRSKHYLLTAGLIWNWGKSVVFRPSTLIKLVPGAPVSADINASWLFKERLWLGASFRTEDAVVLMAQLYITRGLLIGYAYDINTSGLSTFNSGSHELMLGFDFSFAKKAMVNPRYF